MKLKNDINLLKAAGNKQKIQSKTPVQLILVIVAVAIIGFFGYTFFTQSKQITELQNSITSAKRIINNAEYNKIVEKNSATIALTDDITEAIEIADKLGGFYDTVPAMFPELSERHLNDLKNAVYRASNSSVEDVTYTNATAIVRVNSTEANLETDVIDQLLDCKLFRKVAYQCPVCGKATYYTVTPPSVYCNYDHSDLPDVDVAPNEDGTYTTTYVCALKNIVDIVVEAPVLTSTTITVTRPEYSGTTLTIKASCDNADALKNYYNSIFDSGYFLPDTQGYSRTEVDGTYTMTVVCNIPQIEIAR